MHCTNSRSQETESQIYVFMCSGGERTQNSYYIVLYRLLTGLQSAFKITLCCNSASRDIIAKAKLPFILYTTSHMPIRFLMIFVFCKFVTEDKSGRDIKTKMSSLAARNLGRLLPRLVRAAERQRHLSSLTPISVTRSRNTGLHETLRTTSLGSGYSSTAVFSREKQSNSIS